jgi:hypothetical protein
MTAEWRQFEKLIARIEHAMAPSRAVVTSPDRIPDKVTGELREVDASIRYKIGTCPVLITIECRDRTSVEDVRWIEQLAEKQRSIGAAITVAVSSLGFTDPAIKKAIALGIQVRTLTDASADDFIHWLKFQNVELDISKWALAALALELYDAPDDAELVPALQQSFRQQGPLAPIFVRNSDGRRFSIESILIEWNKTNGTFFPDDLPSDGTNIRRNLHQRLDRGCLHVETTKGNCDIRIIHIGLSLSRSKAKVPVAQFSEYADSSSVLVQTAEWNLQHNIKLSLHRDLTSGETKIRLTSDETPNCA